MADSRLQESDTRSCPTCGGAVEVVGEVFTREFEIRAIPSVSRSDAEALAEALKRIANLPGHAAEWRRLAREALAAYRSRHPKETP